MFGEIEVVHSSDRHQEKIMEVIKGSYEDIDGKSTCVSEVGSVLCGVVFANPHRLRSEIGI